MLIIPRERRTSAALLALIFIRIKPHLHTFANAVPFPRNTFAHAPT